MANKFNTSSRDSQATAVNPVSVQNFNFSGFADYENSLSERCTNFWKDNSGLLIYRRMRVGEVFSYSCKDMKNSLELQLGALQKSILYKADTPNFLEPWYGIGTISASYGSTYYWAEGQAPAVKPIFKSVTDALKYEPKPVKETGIGRHTLNMIEYFLDQTKGELPISLTDTQSPLNAACNIVDISSFMMDTIVNPDYVKEFLDIIAELLIDFTQEQLKLIGDNIVWPGHGFASSRYFNGIGMSDDNMLMLSGQTYIDLIIPSIEKFGNMFGGSVFHSCGNWSDRMEFVKQIRNLRMVDGAFSEETDPDPNPATPFQSFAKTNIVLNARMVGNNEMITEKVKQIWNPGMKLIVVTYCDSPEKQENLYDRLLEICT